MKILLLLTCCCLTLGLATSLRADNSDPDSNRWKIASVAWLKANTEMDYKDIDDKYVVLIGKITERVDEDTYRIDDGTGTALLDVADGVELPVGKRVVVRGQIDEAYWDVGELELNVQSWRFEHKS